MHATRLFMQVQNQQWRLSRGWLRVRGGIIVRMLVDGVGGNHGMESTWHPDGKVLIIAFGRLLRKER